MARSVTYDYDAVVEQALRQFWSEGFGNCDVEQLTRKAKVNRHSLYKTFGGKKGLFDEALGRYIDTIAADFITVLQEGTGLEAIQTYFRKATGTLRKQTDEGYGPRGCLITNTVVEMGRGDADVNAIIDRYYTKMTKEFSQAIRRGQKDGSIRSDLDAGAAAKWLIMTSQGLSVSARFGAPADNLVEVIGAALSPPSSE